MMPHSKPKWIYFLTFPKKASIHEMGCFTIENILGKQKVIQNQCRKKLRKNDIRCNLAAEMAPKGAKGRPNGSKWRSRGCPKVSPGCYFFGPSARRRPRPLQDPSPTSPGTIFRSFICNFLWFFASFWRSFLR